MLFRTIRLLLAFFRWKMHTNLKKVDKNQQIKILLSRTLLINKPHLLEAQQYWLKFVMWFCLRPSCGWRIFVRCWPCCRLLKPWAPRWDGGEHRDCELGLTEETRAGRCRGLLMAVPGWADGLRLMERSELVADLAFNGQDVFFLVGVCKCQSTEF